ncbi:hypothetical protein MWN34_11865 [Ancylobacter sp. 6x-1]|uniref:MarR family transcriptional regulator n=1 Tax=Ancylobacter crimeensis TaxID=2579147 RepID=A0ABT0DCB7_9HYPH|nr:hypothetical protein [Ancylobacter crimeensis]MCK0197608.1 hypothetical protein [Ancylobacter crimeensis]
MTAPFQPALPVALLPAHAWEAGSDIRPALPDSVSVDAALRSEIMAHPRFCATARQAATVIADSYRGRFIVNQIISDRGRFCLGLLVVDFTHRENAPIGFTSTEMKAEAARLGLCSAGRVDAFLATLRLFGLLAPVPDDDRRRRRLMVTEKLMALHRTRWEALFAVLAEIAPDLRGASRRFHDSRFAAAYVRALLAPIYQGWRAADATPELSALTDRNMGAIIPLALLETAYGAAPMSVAGLARSFGVSRSHVQKLLETAEDAGLVVRPDPRLGFIATPALVRASHGFIAALMARQIAAARQDLHGAGSEDRMAGIGANPF